MKILLPANICHRFEKALERAGSCETGGVLMGEALEANTFRIVDFSLQYGGGTVASFIRAIETAIEPLQRFFTSTGRNYRKYNYLGEWHSHPTFKPEPSARDDATMQGIINDAEVGANFVVLMVIKLQNGTLQATVTGYVPCSTPFKGELCFE